MRPPQRGYDGGGWGVMFHTQRSLEEEGHVVCREYREDWKRVGEGVEELTACDGSLSSLLWGNFPLFFSQEGEVTQETQCCRLPWRALRIDLQHAVHAIQVIHPLHCRWVILTAVWSSRGKNKSSPHVPAKQGGIIMENTGVNVSFLYMISFP